MIDMGLSHVMGEPPPVKASDLRAEGVRYSSIVGSSVVLSDAGGRVIAQFAIMLPGLTGMLAPQRKAVAEDIARRLIETWNQGRKS